MSAAPWHVDLSMGEDPRDEASTLETAAIVWSGIAWTGLLWACALALVGCSLGVSLPGEHARMERLDVAGEHQQRDDEALHTLAEIRATSPSSWSWT